MSKKLLLIDGYSLLFRAFYGMPLSMSAPDGTHTNAVYGFITILHKMIEEEAPDYLACALDTMAPTFRHKMYENYKGNRSAAPDEFHEQVPVMKKLLSDMAIPILAVEGWEADDVLGTLARQAEERGIAVSLLSGDRDLLQIASEGTTVVIPKTKGGTTTYERYTPADVEAAFGVDPRRFIELKALMGDSSDNVPGLPGVGPKTALKILTAFGTIENAHDHVEEITPRKAKEAMRDFYDQLLLSRELVTIRTDAPVLFDEEAFRIADPYNASTYEDFKQLGFKSLLGRFEKETAEKAGETLAEPFVLTDPKEAEAVLTELSGREKLGISVLSDFDTVYTTALSDGKHTWILRPSKAITPSFLSEKLGMVLKGGNVRAAFDVKAIEKLVPLENEGRLFDAGVAAYLIDPLKSDWGVSSVAAGYLSWTLPSMTELIGRKGLKEAQPDKIDQYAAQCAGVACLSYDSLYAKLDELGMKKLFDEIEMPLTYVLASMEKEGILASEEALNRYSQSLAARIDELENEIWEEAGESFNINSPKQLGLILFEKMGLVGGKKTKTGFSTAADVLEKLAPDNRIVRDILEYRTLTKLKSTYADGLPSYIQSDGKIHTVFHQTVAATGRLSSSDPNLQNIPMREELGRQIRKCFTPKEGCVFVDADYSQIELRILAHMSKDEKLIEAYKEAEDIHRITASQVFHTPFDQVTDQQRRNAKAVNFGIVYGISSFGLSQGLSISRKTAQEYINQYFETYPSIRQFLDNLVSSAKETGCAYSLYGRRRPIPELKSANFATRSFGERVAMNSPIQGTAADIMKIAMIRVWERLKRETLEARLILQIHDELLIEAPESEAEYVKALLSEEMENAASLRVPLETDCHIGTDWYEAK